MAKPKSSNRSIRLPDEMWTWLAAEAERRQNSVNGLVGEFLMVARLKAEERSAKPTRDDGPMLYVNASILQPKAASTTSTPKANPTYERQDTYPDWMRPKRPKK